MKKERNLVIWMDHSNASLIDVSGRKNNNSITSKFTIGTEEEALSRSESLINNKRKQMQETYYKEIADEILNYDHVLLFGPSNAKSELHNYLNKDSHFKNTQIEI